MTAPTRDFDLDAIKARAETGDTTLNDAFDLIAEVERLRAEVARLDSTGCPSVHPIHGKCYDLAGHYVDGDPDKRHYIATGDEFGEYDIPWTDAEATAEDWVRCPDQFDEDDDLGPLRCVRDIRHTGLHWDLGHVHEWGETPTEEPDRTLTAPERDAEQEYIAPVGVYGDGWTDPNAELTDTAWVSDAIDGKAVEL